MEEKFHPWEGSIGRETFHGKRSLMIRRYDRDLMIINGAFVYIVDEFLFLFGSV